MTASNDAAALPEVKVNGARPFPPRVSAFSRPFWQALDQGRLITTHCGVCDRYSFPPRNLCRQCWSRSVQWVPLKPFGTLYSFTRVHIVPGAFSAQAPYSIGIVDLADGVRLMCRLEAPVHADDLDHAVQMIVLRYDDGPLFGARVAR